MARSDGRWKGRFLCVTGVDGAGKSTAARELVARLGEADIKASYVYARYVPFLLLPLMWAARLAFLARKDERANYVAHRNAKVAATGRHRVLSRIYISVMLSDYVAQIFFKIRLPLAAGRNIVCDRYIYDTILTDLQVDFNLSESQAMDVLSRMARRVPEPDLLFFIDIDPQTAFLRKTDVPSQQYLEDRIGSYRTMAHRLGAVVIDGLQSRDEVAAALVRAARRQFGVDT